MRGEGGVGKTRLLTALADEARRRGWTVASGRGYAVERGVPYALIADAFVPLLRAVGASSLQVLTRGGMADLVALFPALSPDIRNADQPDRARMLHTFSQLVMRLAAKQPLLVVLDNVQWADASSLELLHYAARQVREAAVLFVCAYNDAESGAVEGVGAVERSLLGAGIARVQKLEPLTETEVRALVHAILPAADPGANRFAARLHGWTRGNAFFVEETIKAMVARGTLALRDGRWTGWEGQEFEPPSSVREAVAERIGRLGADARAVANVAAVLGVRAAHRTLSVVAELEDAALLASLDELRAAHVFMEIEEDGAVQYDFAHPIVQEVLYASLGAARARRAHERVARALEARYGSGADEHAGELALHFGRAGNAAESAARYAVIAGRAALGKYANREAADYLRSALERCDALGAGSCAPVPEVDRVPEDLARALQRLGDFDEARRLLARAAREATARGDHSRRSAIERRLGVLQYWTADYDGALAHYDVALEAATAAGDLPAAARAYVSRAACLLEIGRRSDAEEAAHRANTIADQSGDPALRARAARALMLLHVWSGPADVARAHGARALKLAEEAGTKTLAWQAHWALAMLEGLTGNSAPAGRHLVEAERLASELRSPALELWTAEVKVEYLTGVGDWDAALELGSRAIESARALGQRTLLPRLLVWTGLVHLARGDTVRAKAQMDEAWKLSGAGRGTRVAADVHLVVPAHAGLAAYYVAIGDHARAIEVGEAGLAIADSTGYVAWAIHRLLPAVGEASLWKADLDRAERYGQRLRQDAEHFGHPLGMAWADACDALVALLRGEPERAVGLLRAAVDSLDAVPMAADAARLRRHLARALAEAGDRDGAERELHTAHAALARLGAGPELAQTRMQLRELGAPAPVAEAGDASTPTSVPRFVIGVAETSAPVPQAEAVTPREREIAQFVAARRSNKEIGDALGISSRTVSTHLSNLFAKLGVRSRGELTDLVRGGGLGSD